MCVCSIVWLTDWLIDCLTDSVYFVQPTAFRCWSSRMLTAPTPSIVRGWSLKSDSTTREATTGSATTCSVNWQKTTATSWDLSCSYAISAGTGPSTVHSLCSVRDTTTGCWYPGTQVTLVMRSVTATRWCSARMTVTMTGAAATVQHTTAADSGTTTAPIARSTLFVTISTGISHQLEITTCRHHACGWRARSLRWLSRYPMIHNQLLLVHQLTRTFSPWAYTVESIGLA